MVTIAPFRGVVYGKAELEESGGSLFAPPYDVLTQAQQNDYLKSHEHNFLHIDLGSVLEDDPDPLSWHDRSASTLTSWLNSGVLVRREHPSMVLMDTEWKHPLTGRRLTRHGLICLMKLEPWSKESKVRRHEMTFSYHKMERLDLMEKTSAQLSPAFGFFPDPDDKILKAMYDLVGDSADLTINERAGLTHHISFLQNNDRLTELIEGFSDTTIYIADGHHRYETALKYRDQVLAQMAKNGQEPVPNSAIDYVMIYLSSMSDPGLCVLPTHRVLSCCDLSNAEVLKALEPFVEVKAFPKPKEGPSETALSEMVKKMGRDDAKGLTVFGLCLKDTDTFYFLKIRERVKHKAIKAKPEDKNLLGLDVSILTNIILKEALGYTESDLDDPKCISYFSSIQETVEAVNKNGNRAAFILNPTSLEEIIKVAEDGMTMPRKATYFYPKVSSGVVFNLVNPMESVPDLLKAQSAGLGGGIGPVSDF
ncbi:MAG: DUF1015 domain-containing protein [Deltaproteobacteria bacterium]|jgi:uncharacterized protein (DUF1015 family)|nr:DUF1015 domain-containing protein [Deltaproteobacteria bacterium]